MTLEKPAGAPVKLGSYELIREQGGIGAGTQWIARAEGDAASTPKLFSVIRVHKHLLKKPEVAEAFLADTTPAVGFAHANVVPLVDAKSEGGELFAVSEHVEGELLSNLANTAGPTGLPQPVVLRIALDVLEALAAAHEREPAVCHGELGPHQILVGADGVARVTGLTTARALSRISTPIGPKNQERLAYAAPERVKAMSTPGGAASAPAPDARADLFSAAVILWEGLAKQRLFGSKIEAAIVQKVLSGAIAALSTVPGANVPADLDAAVQKALEREPAKRTRSAAMLIAAIEGSGAAIADAKQVAELVEKLAGKAIAARRAELTKPAAAKPGLAFAKPATEAAKPAAEAAKPAAEAAKPAAEAAKPAEAAKVEASKPAAEAPKPVVATPKPGGVVPRKATLLGIPSPMGPKPAAAAPAAKAEAAPEAKPASTPKPAAKAEAAPEAKPASTPKPPSAKPPIRVDEGLDDDEAVAVEAVPVEAPKAPPKPPVPGAAKRTLVMGTPAAKPVEPAKPAAPAAADGPKSTAKPAVHLDPVGGKTAHTPASDERSPVSRARNVGTEKVGPGSTLGRYEILMPVARGGMASVWAARLPGSRGFQKIFAIKTMLPDVSDDPDFENMFLDEGRVAARIRHPNVVEIIDLGEQDEVLYLVMEWVDGENLGAVVKASRQIGGIPLPIVIKIASQIAAGLHAAHELRDDDGNLVDLVHRDVSPANVLVSTSGYVKIVDFGIAKSKGRLHQTRVGGVVKGKTPYLSPEQLGQMPIDRRSDIFSFGVLLYVLTTGLHPFRGETDAKTIENIALREPVPPHHIVPSVPPEFEAVILKALAKTASDRYATAAEMQRALDHAASTIGTTTTEEDVAAFVRQALGETLQKRAQDLRASIDRADGRTPSVSDGPPESTVKPPPAAEAPAEAQPKLQAITLHDITVDTPRPAAPPPAEEPAPEPVAAKPPDEEIAIEEEKPLAHALPAAPPPPTMPMAKVELSPDILPAPTPHFAVPPPPPEPEPAPAFAPPPDSATDAPLELAGVPKRKKNLVPIVVGAVLGLGAIIGAIAAFSGGSKGSTGSAATATATATAAPVRTATPTPPAPPTAAPKPVETTAPAETAAPTPPPAETAPAVAPPPQRPGGTRPPPSVPVRPPVKPGGKTKPSNGKYNPSGI